MKVPKALRTEPVPVTNVLSTQERWTSWFKMNRQPIGLIVLGLSTFFRVGLAFAGHTEAADTLKAVADFLMLGGAATATAGGAKSDSDHKAEMHAKIRRRSGQCPAFQRREGDRYDARPEDRR